MQPIEEGIVPVSPLLLRSIAVTAAPLHVTPVHAGVEHTLVKGVFPEQRHPTRSDIVIVQRFVD